jgi:peptide/nickel transport system substrate-binding protein
MRSSATRTRLKVVIAGARDLRASICTEFFWPPSVSSRRHARFLADAAHFAAAESGRPGSNATTSYVARIVLAGLCDKLFDIDEKLHIVPQLATGYEWSDDRTLVIHLRSGVTFHDGETMNANAVKYSLERHLTLQGSFRKSEISSMDHIEVVDPATVRVVLKNPSGAFLAQLTDRSGMIYPPKATEAAGKDFALHPVCSGPFTFVERVAQDHVTLVRFPEYWDAKDIHLDKAV